MQDLIFFEPENCNLFDEQKDRAFKVPQLQYKTMTSIKLKTQKEIGTTEEIRESSRKTSLEDAIKLKNRKYSFSELSGDGSSVSISEICMLTPKYKF